MSTDGNSNLKHSDVTPKSVYFNRRQLLRAMGIGGAALLGADVLSKYAFPPSSVQAGTKLNVSSKSPFSTTESVSKFADVSSYNNYYEFGTDKGDPAKNAQKFRTSPWTVSVEGEVKKPQAFSMGDILKMAPLEERIYRHRCVERWSIVVPWIGFSLNELIKRVQPNEKAKYVAFTTI